MSGFGDAAAVDPATNHVLMRSGDLGASLLDASAGHESIADMLLAEMAAMGINVASTAEVSWQGPGGQMMTMSASEFILLCETASVWARLSMVQASEVAMAHSSALESMIPAEVVVTNRGTQATLVATNAFGIHSPAIAALEAQYQEFWVQNATARTGYGSVVSTALAALGTPAPFSPDAADPAGPAMGVAQAAASDGSQGALQASAKTMTQAGDATLQGGSSGPESMMSSMVGQIGGVFGQASSSFSQIGGQLPQMLGQAPQLFSSMLGPLTQSMTGANAQTAAALAPEAAGAVGPGLGGVGALGSLGGAGGGAVGDAAVSSSFVRPASSFSAPSSPTLPGGWQGGGPAGEAGAARQAGMGPMGGGGLYGAPAAMGRDGHGSQSEERQGRTMQITPRPSRGEQQRT